MKRRKIQSYSLMRYYAALEAANAEVAEALRGLDIMNDAHYPIFKEVYQAWDAKLAAAYQEYEAAQVQKEAA